MKKTACMTIAVLLVACSQTRANFSGGDDFNDNSLDGEKWGNSSFFDALLIESGTKLTPSSFSGAEWYPGVEWIGSELSYTQSWEVTVLAEVTEVAGVFSSGDLLGIGIFVMPKNNGVISDSEWLDISLEKHVDMNGYSGFHHGVNSAVESDSEPIAFGAALTNATEVVLRIAYDAESRMLFSSYDYGTGYKFLSTAFVDAWGMTSADGFVVRLVLSAENFSGTPGSATLDNFKIVSGQGVDPDDKAISAGDNFSDASMDSLRWSEYLHSSDRMLVEQNGRLEALATATAANPDVGAWEWIATKADYDRNWSALYDVTIALNETTYGGEAWVGFIVADPLENHEVSIEQWISPSGGGSRGVGAGAESYSVNQGEVYHAYSNNTVTLRVDYDSGKKELHASYDNGGGYWNYLASQSVTNWGMLDTNNFRVVVFGGSENNALTTGQVYGDNFCLEQKLIESDPEVVIPCQSIVGSWYIKDGDRPSHDNVAITFLTNGIYFMCQDGSYNPPGAIGYDGMEKGTYSWNPITGELTNSVLEDTNAQWGFSDPPMSGEVFAVEGNRIYVGELGVDPFVLHRVIAQKSPASLVGSWIVGNDLVAITFLDNGIYYLSHSDGGANATGWPGMERGIYTWDPVTGAFTAMALVDTTGDWGLYGGSPTSGQTISVNGNTAHFTIPGDGEFDMVRVVDSACSDIDADGLPDAFELQYYGNSTNGTPNANSDGDDLTDREEFIAGTLPDSGASTFVVSNAPPSPAGHVLVWNALRGRVYSVEWTDDLASGFQSLTNGIAYPQNSYTDTVHAAESGGFYNLKVQLEN